MNLLDLPTTLLYRIAGTLDVAALANLAACSKSVRKLLADDAAVWRPRCLDHNISSLEGFGTESWHTLYRELIFPFGSLEGLWQGDCPAVGSLLAVELKPPGLCASVFCPQGVNRNPFSVPIFQAQLESNEKVAFRCLRPQWACCHDDNELIMDVLNSFKSPAGRQTNVAHSARLVFLSAQNSRHILSFTLECDERCRQEVVELHLRLKAARSLTNQPAADGGGELPELLPFGNEMHVLQFMVCHQVFLDHYARSGNTVPGRTAFRRLSVPGVLAPRKHPLEGVWKGTYGGHGLEVVTLTLQEDDTAGAAVCEAESCCKLLVGTKATGDPNVPRGEQTFRVCLSHVSSAALPETFSLPGHFESDVDLDSRGPLHPVACYPGKGCIARTGFAQSGWVDVQMYVFHNHSFGILWRTLDSFSFFSRLELPLSRPMFESIAQAG